MNRTLGLVVAALLACSIACGSTSPPRTGATGATGGMTPTGGHAGSPAGGQAGGRPAGQGGTAGGGRVGGSAGGGHAGGSGGSAGAGGQGGSSTGGQAGGFTCGAATCAAGQVCHATSNCSGSLTCTGPADAGQCPAGQRYTTFCAPSGGPGCMPACAAPVGTCEDLTAACTANPTCDCLRVNLCNGSAACTTLPNGFNIVCERQ